MPAFPKGYRKFQEKYPQVYAAYETLGKTTAENDPLEEKTCELIKLGFPTMMTALS